MLPLPPDLPSEDFASLAQHYWAMGMAYEEDCAYRSALECYHQAVSYSPDGKPPTGELTQRMIACEYSLFSLVLALGEDDELIR